MPELLFRDRRLDGHRRHDRQLCWCVRSHRRRKVDARFTPTSSLSISVAWLFLVVSTYQMVVWAIKKHKNYKKEFGKAYPANRKAMFPFIL